MTTKILRTLVTLSTLVIASIAHGQSSEDRGNLQGGSEGCTTSLVSTGCAGSGRGHITGTGATMNGADHNYECYLCFVGDVEVGYSSCHWSSGCGGDPSPDYAALVSAAATGNVALVVRMAPKNSQRVYVNLARNAIQILNCKGDKVIGSLPVADPAILRAVLASLPTSGTAVLRLETAPFVKATAMGRLFGFARAAL